MIGRYPITQLQWQAVVAMPAVNQELKAEFASYKGDNHPAVYISWNDAFEFCNRLRSHTGLHYRLPSEAEWEYACRAGTTSPFNFGENISTDLANYNGSYSNGKIYEGITPTNFFGIANPWGLSDMHGNVWEWCQDRWHDNYDGAPLDGRGWFQDGEQDSRVMRGGSWYCYVRQCRSAYRKYNAPNQREPDFGFRVVREC